MNFTRVLGGEGLFTRGVDDAPAGQIPRVGTAKQASEPSLGSYGTHNRKRPVRRCQRPYHSRRPGPAPHQPAQRPLQRLARTDHCEPLCLPFLVLVGGPRLFPQGCRPKSSQFVQSLDLAWCVLLERDRSPPAGSRWSSRAGGLGADNRGVRDSVAQPVFSHLARPGGLHEQRSTMGRYLAESGHTFTQEEIDAVTREWRLPC